VWIIGQSFRKNVNNEIAIQFAFSTWRTPIVSHVLIDESPEQIPLFEVDVIENTELDSWISFCLISKTCDGTRVRIKGEVDRAIMVENFDLLDDARDPFTIRICQFRRKNGRDFDGLRLR